MTIQEFSKENSMALLYATIILFVLVVILFFALAFEGGRGRKMMSADDYRAKDKQMINKDINKTRDPYNSSNNLPVKSGSQSSVTVEVKP